MSTLLPLSLPPPPSLEFVRALGLHHWYNGLALFDGKTPLIIAHQYNKQINECWVHTIELIDNKIYCITRLNDSIKECFEAATL